MTNEEKLLKSTSERLHTLAKKAGAESSEVCATFHASQKMTLEKQDFQLASADEGFHFGLRVQKGAQQGFAACNNVEDSDIENLAERAMKIAAISPPNPHQAIGQNRKLKNSPNMNLWVESLAETNTDEMSRWIKELSKIASEDKRFRINDGAVDHVKSASFVSNTNGISAMEKDSQLAWSLMGMAVEGEEITSFDFFHQMTRHPETIEKHLTDSTRDFCQSVTDSLKTGPGKSYKGVVVFSPRAAQQILLGGILYHLNGRNVLEGTSRWNLDDINQEQINTMVTLHDDPWSDDRSGACAFDREGVPTEPLALIEQGKISHFLFDSYAAQGLKTQSTGHASGSASSLPSVGCHSLNMAGGTKTYQELLEETSAHQKQFLVVHRFSGNVDPITGDFSGVAKGAHWWSEGAQQHTVKETLVSGNVFDCLGSSLVGLSQECLLQFSSHKLPWVLCDNVSVTSNG